MITKLWKLQETEFAKENIEKNGSRFLVGNGYMGYRGTLEEFNKEQLVSLNMAGLFDKSGDLWRESVNAPNPFYVKCTVDGVALDVRGENVVSHTQTLDISCALHSRNTVFSVNDTQITVESERFLSLKEDELAAIIERYNLILIEDDNTGILPAAAPDYHSMFSRLPKQTVYICNSTMTLCNGLRVAFAAFPESFRLQLLNALYLLNIKTSSFDAEIVTELILSGKASKILEQKAALARRRNQIADSILPQMEKAGSTAAFFRWFKLPQGVPDGIELEKQLLEHKVNVYAAYRFTVLRKPGNYLRLAISSPVSDEELSAGLSRVRDFVKQYTAEN